MLLAGGFDSLYLIEFWTGGLTVLCLNVLFNETSLNILKYINSFDIVITDSNVICRSKQKLLVQAVKVCCARSGVIRAHLRYALANSIYVVEGSYLKPSEHEF